MKPLQTNLNDDKYILIKIGQRDTLENIKNGSIWFQSPKYYQQFSDNSAINDPIECASTEVISGKNINPHSIKKYISQCKDNINKELKTNSIEPDTWEVEQCAFLADESDTEQNKLRLLCFYILHIDKDTNINKLDRRLKEFGDCFMCVNLNKLLTIIGIGNTNECLIKYGPVKYFSLDYSGTLDSFKKLDAYSYQQEYRIVIYSNNFLQTLDEKEPYKLQFNSDNFLDVFSDIYPLENLFNNDNINDVFPDFKY